MPNHEPRGCARGASYSWYLYSANRVKYPMVRGRLLKHWREARLTHDPVEAWASIVEDDAKRRDYQSVRGLGGFVRSSWDEVNEIVAAANVYTIKKHGPDRVIGFSPIPAMSMVSYAAGSRYLSLIGGVCMSFYDWYCDLPPSQPAGLGRADRRARIGRLVQLAATSSPGARNVPQTRTPDAHFFTEVRYKGTKTVAVTPDYSEVAKLVRHLAASRSRAPTPRVAMAMGHVILKEFYFDKRSALLRRLRAPLHRPADAGDAEGAHAAGRRERSWCPTATCAPRDFDDKLGQANNPEWKTVAFDETGKVVLPQRRDRLPLGPRRPRRPGPVEPRSEGSAHGQRREAQAVAARRRRAEQRDREGRLPVLRRHRQRAFPEQRAERRAGAHGAGAAHRARQGRRAARGAGRHGVRPAGRATTAWRAASPASSPRSSYDDDTPYTPAWQERITGTPRDQVITVARQFADNARQDAGQVDGDHRRGDEPLVPQRHELPRRHQHADAVRLHRQERRRLGALRRPGEAAAADRLDRARLRARLDPPAAPDEQHQLLLRAHRPVALREAGRGRGALAARRQEASTAAA